MLLLGQLECVQNLNIVDGIFLEVYSPYLFSETIPTRRYLLNVHVLFNMKMTILIYPKNRKNKCFSLGFFTNRDKNRKKLPVTLA